MNNNLERDADLIMSILREIEPAQYEDRLVELFKNVGRTLIVVAGPLKSYDHVREVTDDIFCKKAWLASLK